MLCVLIVAHVDGCRVMDNSVNKGHEDGACGLGVHVLGARGMHAFHRHALRHIAVL